MKKISRNERLVDLHTDFERYTTNRLASSRGRILPKMAKNIKQFRLFKAYCKGRRFKKSPYLYIGHHYAHYGVKKRQSRAKMQGVFLLVFEAENVKNINEIDES